MKNYLRAFLILVMVLSMALLAGPATPAKAASTWWVDDTGDNSTGDGSVGNPWGGIAFATKHASVASGDIIMVKPGVYTDNITVNKSLTIQGNSTTNTFVIAANANRPVFKVNAGSTTIKNLSIGQASSSVGIYVASTASSCTIDSDNISGNKHIRNRTTCFTNFKGILLDLHPIIKNIHSIHFGLPFFRDEFRGNYHWCIQLF